MIFSAFFTSTTGLQAASTFLDVVGNNIANSGTPGFKIARPAFQDLLYTGLAAGAPGQGVSPPGGSQLGNGVALAAVTGLFTQGPLTPTGRALDLAINGNGFFQVTRPDGTPAYTRAGNLTLDATGRLVTADGLVLSPGITVPSGSTSLSVAADGTVSAVTPAGPRVLGQIAVVGFPNPAGLQRVGDTLFAETPASGPATTAPPGTARVGTVQAGALEGSNVDLASELINLLIAQRTFQVNSQALAVENQVLADTADLIP